MQNTIQKFRQISIVFKNPGILPGSLKTLMSSNYPTVQYFLLKLCTRFLLTNVYKRGCGILLDLELFAKIKKDLVSTHSLFTLLLITQDLNKTSPVKVFKFSDKKPGFLEIREVCLNLGIRFSIT